MVDFYAASVAHFCSAVDNLYRQELITEDEYKAVRALILEDL